MTSHVSQNGQKQDPYVYQDINDKKVQTGGEKGISSQFPQTAPKEFEQPDQDVDEDDQEYNYKREQYFLAWEERNEQIHRLWLETIEHEKHKDESEAIKNLDTLILKEAYFSNLTDTPQQEYSFQDLHITQKILRYEINFQFRLLDDSSINEKANMVMIGTQKSKKLKLYLLKVPPKEKKEKAKYKLCLEYRVKDNKRSEQAENEEKNQKQEVSYSHKIISNHETNLASLSENEISICYKKDEKGNSEIILKWRLKVKEPHQQEYQWKDKDETMASHKNEILVPDKTDYIFVGSNLPQDYFQGVIFDMHLWCEVNSNEVPERQAKRLQYVDIEKNNHMETSKAFVPQELNRTMSQSRPFSAVSQKSAKLGKSNLGLSVVSTDTLPFNDTQSYFGSTVNQSTMRMSISGGVPTLGDVLESPEMMKICRAIADNYVWISTISNLLSPTVDQTAIEEGQLSHSFPCLASELRRLCKENAVYIAKSKKDGLKIYIEEHPEVSRAWPLSKYLDKNMPLSLIEIDRFLQILHFSQIPITREELVSIAKTHDFYKKYTQHQFQKTDHQVIAREEDRELQQDIEWTYEAILYEKFLKYCRDSFLDATEREKVVEQCYLTVKNFDEDKLNMMIKAKEVQANGGNEPGAGAKNGGENGTQKRANNGGNDQQKFISQAIQEKEQGQQPKIYSINTLNQLRRQLKEEGKPCSHREMKKWRLVAIDFVKYCFSPDLIDEQVMLAAALQRENVVNVLEFFDSLKIVRNVGLNLGAFQRLIHEWELHFEEPVMKHLFLILSGGRQFVSAQRLHDFIHGFYLHVVYAKINEQARAGLEKKSPSDNSEQKGTSQTSDPNINQLFEFQTISIFEQKGEQLIPLFSNPFYLENSNYDFEEFQIYQPKDCEYYQPYFLYPSVVQQNEQKRLQQNLYRHMDNWYAEDCLDSGTFIGQRRSHQTKVIHGFNVKFRFVNIERLSLIKKLQYVDFEPIFTRRFTPFSSSSESMEDDLKDDFLDIATSFTEEELQHARQNAPFTISFEVFKEILIHNFTRRYRKLHKIQLYDLLDQIWEEVSQRLNVEYNFWLFFKPVLLPKEQQFPAYKNTPDLMPSPDPNWNQGKVEIVVHHCMYCERHQEAFTHEQLDFLEKFTRLGDNLKQIFPNMKVQLFKPPEPKGHPGQVEGFEHFDVYAYGVGEPAFRDNLQRITLYKKIDSMKNFRMGGMFQMISVLDWLVLLSLTYGTSTDLEEEQIFNTEELGLEKTDGENYIEHPLRDLPKRKVLVMEEFQKEEKDELQKYGMFCQNWGCYQEFKYSPDSANVQKKDSFYIQFKAREFEQNPNPSKYSHMCRFHPGEYQPKNAFGGDQEYWTCCFGNWDSEGCFMGAHRSTPLRRTRFLCTNHGEINPKTGIPDSACGKSFLKNQENLTCQFHQGYFDLGQGKWTCCGDDLTTSKTCTANDGVEHKESLWPDETAQIVWVMIKYKFQMTTSLGKQDSDFPNRWEKSKSIKFIKELDPSRQFNPGYVSIPKNEEEYYARELPYEMGQDIFCKNWGCNKMFVFSETLLHSFKAAYKSGGMYIKFNQNEFKGDTEKTPAKYKNWCRYHPGKLSIPSRFGADRQFWTCCSQPYESPGCYLGCHKFYPKDQLFFNCINHGQINPVTKRPDSACGLAFRSEDIGETCQFHPQMYNLETRRWDCCKKSQFDAEPCKKTSHRTAVWPTEQGQILWIIVQDFHNNLSKTWVQQGILPDQMSEQDLDKVAKFSLSSVVYKAQE